MTNKKVPAIRFEGFTNAWELRKLSEVKDVRDGTHDSPKYFQQGHPLVTSKNLTDSGLDMTDVSLISDEDYEAINKRSKVDVGDIIFGMIGTIGNPVIVDRADFAIKNVALIKGEGEIPNAFLIQLLKSPIFERYIRNENVGNTQKFLGLSKIRDYTFLSPTTDEMTKIGDFLVTIDTIIALHQRKLASLKEMKKGFLQKMFPKAGAKVPEIRFPGFTDAWEQRKSKELCSISTGKGNTQDKVKNGKYPFYVRSATIEHSNEYLYDQEAVLTVGDGVGTGKVFHYVNEKYNLHQRVYRMFDFKDDMLGKYYYYFFSNHFYRRVMSMTAKTSVDSVRMDMIADMNINYPSIDEQQKIVCFLSSLDNTITLHQRQLDLLKETKKGFLQKMFV